MRRHMSKDAVHPNHWPELSNETQYFIDSDEYANELYQEMRNTAWLAINWYDKAEKDREVTRWIPQGGGGDCYLIYPADENAHKYHAMYDALTLYAKVVGREDVWNELNELRDSFLWLDMSEAS